MNTQAGAVVIGRNEGERLQICLRSLCESMERIVYVDSGSTDGSVEFAQSMGIEVVSLDLSRPFTAARARNEGVDRLERTHGSLEFVQFVDGDCEVVSDWVKTATQALEQDAGLAVVCGRRRERFPERTVYNRLCDMEWNTPIGEANECGGDAMIRLSAFRSVGGYPEEMIAGEEPDLCVRLRSAGWRVLRLDHEMTLHDAAMTRFAQFWKRCVRGGHAYAEGAARHGQPPIRHKVRQLRSAIFWGGGMPLLFVAALLVALWTPLAWVLVPFVPIAYLYLAFRIYQYRRRTRQDSARHALVYAGFVALGKLPEFLGAVHYGFNALRGRRSRLIEYKGAEPAASKVRSTEGAST